MNQNTPFTKYFADWIETYKQNAVRPVTYRKYTATLKRLTEIAPTLTFSTLDRRAYQGVLNVYAETHERQTTLDFHHHLRAALLDAVDEGLLEHDPTRKAVAKGIVRNRSKVKYLNLSQLANLLSVLQLDGEISWDHFIFLLVKTGLRFAEALGLTPSDFDIDNHTLSVSKTWDYKSATSGFAPTKNESSKRIVSIDRQTIKLVQRVTQPLSPDQPIFVRPGHRVFNEVVNSRLRQLCKTAGIPTITIHGLRHTHASILLYAGVSVASVASRLGHANMTTTQKIYLHIIKELEDQDNEKIIKCLEYLV